MTDDKDDDDKNLEDPNSAKRRGPRTTIKAKQVREMITVDEREREL